MSWIPIELTGGTRETWQGRKEGEGAVPASLSSLPVRSLQHTFPGATGASVQLISTWRKAQWAWLHNPAQTMVMFLRCLTARKQDPLSSWATKPRRKYHLHRSPRVRSARQPLPSRTLHPSAKKSFLQASEFWLVQPRSGTCFLWFYFCITFAFLFGFSTLQHCLTNHLFYIH